MDVPALTRVLSSCRRAAVWLLVFSLAINLLILASPIYMMQIFDRVLSSGRMETLLFLTVIAGVAVIFMGAIEIVRGQFMQRAGRWLVLRLAPEVIEATMRSSQLGNHNGAQPLRDLASVRTTIVSPSISALFDAPWAPIFILVIFFLHPWLGGIAVGAAVLLMILALLNELAARRPLKEASRLVIGNTYAVDAALRNAEAIHAMGMLPNFLVRYARTNDESLHQLVQAGDRNAAMVGISKALRIFVQILILGTGAYLVLGVELTPGGMIAASILLGRALAPVEQLIGAWKQLVGARQAWGRLDELFYALPPRPKTMPLAAPEGRLSCERVVYAVPQRERPILGGIDLTVGPREALSIVGPSAAGKSSLCKILVGAWRPTGGHVRLDGADVYTWDAAQLGRFLGYLPQDVGLFGGSIIDNIARLAPDPNPTAVIEAAKIAGVHDMILALPNGYETEIGEGGAFLSGGQRQSIGLARAFYGRPRLIVLDEPNTSLDANGEEKLLRAIMTAKGWGASVVIVSHQPRMMLRSVDKLLLLRDGVQHGFGPRDKVLSQLRAVRLASQDGTAVEAVEAQTGVRNGRTGQSKR